MRGVFDEKDFETGRPRRNAELTLSSTTVLGIFFGMVLLCGLFFGFGFAVGRYGPSESPLASMKPAPNAEPTTIVATNKPKPSATEQFSPQQPVAAAAVPVSAPVAPAGSVPAAGQTSVNPTGANAYQQAGVKPALPQTQYQQAAQPTAAVQPATQAGLPMASGPAAGMMVQIAAVRHTEDAEVLVGALRKRGYAVSVRRLPGDSLLHVQIGPFKSEGEANRWKQKLLNDGYNALLMP